MLKMFSKLIQFLVLLNFCFVFTHQYKFKCKSNDPNLTISLQTNSGTVVGHRKEVQNRTINIFYGVPYAEPPVGRLRFRRSKLIKKLPTDPYEALHYKPHCEQVRAKKYRPNDRFSEDCLYMNIYTPDLESSKANGRCRTKFNVMVYIYGGKSSIYQRAQVDDESEQAPLAYSGELYAALKDTIFVAFNFRQELFASLYLESEFSGNLGLFDQNLAFKWIKQHINEFCGDATQMTVFGNSQGSNAIGLHMISKYSKGLISNAIMQSYSPLFRGIVPVSRNELMVASFLAINDLNCLDLTDRRVSDYLKSLDDQVRSKFARFIDQSEFLKNKLALIDLQRNWKAFLSKLANTITSLGQQGHVDEEVLKLVRVLSKNAVSVDCLQRVPAERIVNLNFLLTDFTWSFYFDFDYIDTEAYVNYQLFQRLNVDPRVNLLIGAVSDEDCTTRFQLKDMYPSDSLNAPAIPKEEAKKILKASSLLVTDKKGFAQVMADYYTDETKWKLDDGYSEAISNMMSDFNFSCPMHFYAEAAAASNARSVSSYIVTQASSRHFSSFLSDYDLADYSWLGPCHSDELVYLFGLPIRLPERFTQADREFSLRLLEIWTQFAKNGKTPNLQPSGDAWPTSTKRQPKPRYVELNNRYTRERVFEFEERCSTFWRPLLPLYKR